MWSAELQVIFDFVCTKGCLHILSFWNTLECVSGWHHWNSEQNTFYSCNYGTVKALLRQHQRPVNTLQDMEGGELDDVSFTNHVRKGDQECLFIFEFQWIYHEFSNHYGRIWRNWSYLINVLGTEKSLGQTSKNPTYERGFLYHLLISVLSLVEKLWLDGIWLHSPLQGSPVSKIVA